MPDPVSARMGDCLRTGKPPRHGTRHPGLLSVSHPFVGGSRWVPSRVVNRHITWYTSRYPWTCSVGWCLAED